MMRVLLAGARRGLPGFQVIKMATSGAYNYKEMMEKVQRQGGLKAYFGTSDTRQVEAGISKAMITRD